MARSAYLSYEGWKITGRATVGGIEVPVTRVATEFAVNSIPRANITLALGRKADGTESSTNEVIAQSFKKLPTVVKLKFEPKSKRTAPGVFPSAGDEVPQGEFTIFEGMTAGLGYGRTPDRAGYMIDLEHWLADLNYSSSLSSGLHPANPLDLSFPGMLSTVSGDTAAGQSSGITPQALAAVMLGQNVIDDLWKNGILIWFQKLANTDTLADSAVTGNYFLSALLGGNPGKANDAALDALKRMVPSDAMPLKLIKSETSAAIDAIARNIKQQIADIKFENIWSRTLWDLLISFAQDFMFGVLPTVDSAYVVPWLPMQKNPWKTIRITSADRHELSGDTPRGLRSVALRTWKGWDAGANQDQNDITKTSREYGLGVYTNNNFPNGQLIVRDAPQWLGNVPHELAVDACRQPTDLIRSGPGAPAAAKKNGNSGADILKGLSPLMNAYAKAIYASEVFKSRQGPIYGKFRTDIAPGSAVRCELVDDGNGLGRYIFGNAVAVSSGVDCESLQAYTGFTLAHLRTEAENDNIGLANHPLYAQAWKGTRLVEV